MPGIDLEVTCHRFHVDPTYPSITQKAHRTAKVVKTEVGKLLEARSIREVQFPNWLSNSVVVKKGNGNWRVRRLHISQ